MDEKEEQTGKKEPKDMTAEELMAKPARSEGWLVALVIILAIAVFASVLTKGFNDFTFQPAQAQVCDIKDTVSIDTAVEKAMTYINTNILKAPNTALNINATEQDGVYRFTLMVANQTYDSFVTKNGRLLFPTALELPGTTG